MKRRIVLGGAAALSAAQSFGGHAQARSARLAWIGSGTKASAAGAIAAFHEGMRENGLREIVDYSLELFFADGDYTRFPALTQAALARDPAVLLVITIASVQAAQQATRTVPIVFMSTSDPVGAGLVGSLARPGGNTTGLATMANEYAPKLVQLVRESLTQARRLAVLINPRNPSGRPVFEAARAVAVQVGLRIEAVELESPDRVGTVLLGLAADPPDALLLVGDALFTQLAGRIAAQGRTSRIAVFADNSYFVRAGALLSYGASRTALYRRAAWYVKRILDGTPPGSLPVEQPTKFDLTVNAATARALGLAIPPSILAHADEVIE